MKRLPTRPNLEQLKRQAKDLLFDYRSGSPDALIRFRNSLPAGFKTDDEKLRTLGFRLHDAQSCVAREYGFKSWSEISIFVQTRSSFREDPRSRLLTWLRLVYDSDIAGGNGRAKPEIAARILAENTALVGDDPVVACAVGDEAKLRRAVNSDRAWVRSPGGPLKLTPLVAVTHSALIRIPEFKGRLRASAKFLLEVGADPNQAVAIDWNASSDGEVRNSSELTPLDGAAGKNHDSELTELLLEFGANPNDGESLYHALESLDCTRSLLEAGARPSDAFAIYRALDLDNIDVLNLLLAHGANPNEPSKGPPTSHWSSPLLWAIRRRRSPAHIAALLDAGADPSAKSSDGASARTLALRFGLPDVVDLLGSQGLTSPGERFIAACAQADEEVAQQIQLEHPELPWALSPAQLRTLPELAALGCHEPVQIMVKLGWPVTVRAGDWDASALNHAIFRGDAKLARFLLEHGATWTEKHGYGDDASGTLSWASRNRPVEGGDWVGCAEALLAHGMPAAGPDPYGSEQILLNGRKMTFSDEVTDVLLDAYAAKS